MKLSSFFSALTWLAVAASAPSCPIHDDCTAAVASYIAHRHPSFCCHFLNGQGGTPQALGRWSNARIRSVCQCLQPATLPCPPESSSTSAPASTTATSISATSTSMAPPCRATLVNGGFEAGLPPWSVETNGDTLYTVQASDSAFTAHSRARYFRSTCSPTGNACFTAVCQDIYLETGRTYAFSAFAAARCNATGTLGCGGGYAPSANFYISPVGGSDMVRLKEGYTRIAYSLAYTDASTAAQACVYLTVEGVTAGVGLVALDDVQVDVK